MLIYGHRGSSGTESENTVRAFRAALAAGVDGVEFDVHVTADGVPIVIHDADVSRTTDGAGTVAAMTLDQLRRLDAGQGERIPTLEEVLDLLAGRATIDLELKQAGIEAATLAVLDRFPTAGWFISSFDWTALDEIRRLSESAALWPLAMAADDPVFKASERLRSPGIALHHAAYSSGVADRAARADLAVAVWTVNDPAEGRRVRDLGAAILMTDYPAEMLTALAESGTETGR